MKVHVKDDTHVLFAPILVKVQYIVSDKQIFIFPFY